MIVRRKNKKKYKQTCRRIKALEKKQMGDLIVYNSFLFYLFIVFNFASLSFIHSPRRNWNLCGRMWCILLKKIYKISQCMILSFLLCFIYFNLASLCFIYSLRRKWNQCYRMRCIININCLDFRARYFEIKVASMWSDNRRISLKRMKERRLINVENDDNDKIYREKRIQTE